MEPVRILHIVYRLNRGGLESRIMDLYRNINRDKYQYDFYIESGMQGMYDEEVRQLGGRIYYSQNVNKYNIPNFKRFYCFLKEHSEYKMVHAYNQWAGWYLKEAKKCGVPYRIANARTSIQTVSLKNIIKNIIKMNVHKYATHKFAVSQKAANWLFGKCEKNIGDVKIWPNAIDTKKFAFSSSIREEVRNELGLRDNFVVIHVGNIRFEKNHSFLMKVFAEIKSSIPSARLLLVGAGDFSALIQQMNELKLNEYVMFLGIRDDVPRLLQAGDVFIFPSLYEGFPGAVLEAEASGLKCLISDSITSDVRLSENVEMVSLDESPDVWRNKMEKIPAVNREEAWLYVKNSGYDIGDLVSKMEDFYHELNI